MSDNEPAIAAELVRRIRAGEPAAESELVTRYSRGLMFMLLQLTHDRFLSDDLHQETFRRVIEKARNDEIQHPERLSAFVRATAQNLFLGDRRKEGRRPVTEGEPVIEPASGGGGPLGDLLQQESVALVRRLLAQMKHARDREVLCRYYLGEEDKERICADLELDALQLNRVLYKARMRFKELLLRTTRHRDLADEARRGLLVFSAIASWLMILS